MSYLGYFIAVNGHHGHGNSYKVKYLIVVAGLQFQRLNLLSLSWEAWQHAERCDRGVVAESFKSFGQQEVDQDAGQYSEHGKPQSLTTQRMLAPKRLYPLQQSHTS